MHTTIRTCSRLAFFLAIMAWTPIAALGSDQAASSGTTYAKWSRIELSFDGPESVGTGTPNPFSVEVDAVFTSPTGKRYRVPGFYDGDGQGGLDGHVWKIRFSADERGTWTYRTESRSRELDAKTGRFSVTDTPSHAKGFWKSGRLESPGTPENGIRYLKFRDGPYWLKAGCDDPENFLGGYRNFDTPDKRRAAVDYLAGRGMNSLYVMTHNVDGDDRDVWPWLGDNAKAAKANGGKDARFDVAKLETWRQLFETMQTKGVVPYLILEDDSAWKEYDHHRYYREIIARFGYLPALLLNLGEEHNENYRLSQALGYLRRFRDLDPYHHPLGIHNVNRPNDAYVDAEHIDFTSIQTGQPGTRKGVKHAVEHNQIAIDWIRRCQSRGRRVLMVNFDEGRPELDRRAWWSAYLGGGVWEAHVLGPYDRPYSAWATTWTELGGTRTFMESLPFWEMQPRNDLVRDGTAFCLAQPAVAYALYLPEGGTITVDLSPAAAYVCAWWDPDNGTDGGFQNPQPVPGGLQSFSAPGPGDWALRILKEDASGARGSDPTPPTAAEPGDRVWPGRQWAKAKPADVGMDQASLQQARDYALTGGGSGYITRHGKLVTAWGDVRKTYDLKSTSKSIGVTALGLAIGDGKIRLSDHARHHHPTLGTPPESNEPTGWLDEITILHLATQTAGFEKPGGYGKLLFRPGHEWHYSDGGPNWLAECVTLAYKEDIETLMFRRVLTPIGITRQDLRWRNNAYRPHQIDGVARREFGSGVHANVDAMARIGYLYLRRGSWTGQPILRSEFVNRVRTTVPEVVGLPEHDSSHGNASDHYGLLWWNNADGTMEKVPRDAYWSWGLYDSLIVVIPSLDVVVSRAGKSWQRTEGAGHYEVLKPFFQPIVASVNAGTN